MDSNDTDKNLRIYLNDHLAGSTGGLELARRARGNSTDPVRTAMWVTICEEVETDRDVLVQMIERLDFHGNPVKALLAWAGEKVGRLKPNGQISGPSALGQYVELELMFLGVTGKLSLWEALAAADDPRLREFNLVELIARAESQRERLDQHRLALGSRLFGH